ncbi:MAG: transcription-repair coupling factor, partial [Acidimicrobiia bacterium]
GGDTPTLHKMGGADFAKARTKARHAIAEVAAELVELYRARAATEGHAFAPDSPWQDEMEAAFPYEETSDQLHAIEAVKADMERPQPMDRLVCGDVGFGKTEVAIRAAFKAVQDGKQVAVLVPTTLLAQQHLQTFRERFANYPVRVEVLSRFLTAKEAKNVVRDLESGSVDVVIGTHRLLSADITMPRLGLLVIDEEQRFGVNHKERIKALRAHVDVLTLTATPIPRTLEMSLTGIRELSLINTPPEDRQPILTYVGEYSDHVVSEAIRRELLREGQVFYVHDRVADIEHVAERIRSLVPTARVMVAHGQMDESALEQVVLAFARQEADVLVCTTIVESGIDMPTVNTLVVGRADRLGLGQLYQLRGRVGRRGQRAYAYLLHPEDKVLTEQAYERLKTIGEFTDLGSGFKIAMRDLEIRGAGHMLGQVQSGHIAAVGFDLYCEMVTEAVAELTGRRQEPPPEIVIELPIKAVITSAYMAKDDARLEAYRRLGNVRDHATVSDIEQEWRDRYGPPPAETEALLEVAHLRATCAIYGISEIVVARGAARIRRVELKASQRARLARLVPKSLAKDDGELVVPVPTDGREAAQAIRGLLEALELVEMVKDEAENESSPAESGSQ